MDNSDNLPYMGDFTQPQQKYAGAGENCNIAITVIFYPGIVFCSQITHPNNKQINFHKDFITG